MRIAPGSCSCDLGLLFSRSVVSRQRYPQPWHQSRQMSRLRKAKPSRMSLSGKVAHESAEPTKRRARRAEGPFGGMNVTRVGPRLRAAEPAERKEKTYKPGGSRLSSTAEASKRQRPGFRALKMQQALSASSYERRSSIKRSISEVDSFDQFALLPQLRDSIYAQALPGLATYTPTPVQRVAIPALLGTEGSSLKGRRKAPIRGHEDASMEQYLIAAETGSGKTLAYLLPIIDSLKRAEAENTGAVTDRREKKEPQIVARKTEEDHGDELEPPPLSSELNPDAGRPRAIVLLPSAELVDQVGRVAKLLSHTVKFRVALLSSAFSSRVIRNRLFAPNGVDIIISTPHLLASIAESSPNILSRVTHLVADEADSLFDRSFAPTTSAIVDRATPSLEQLILCSATIPRSLDGYLRKRYPEMRRLVTPNLHAVPRRVQLEVVDVEKVPYRGNRKLACADTIYGIGRAAAEQQSDHLETAPEQKRVLVFVNERESADEVAGFLQSKGIDAFSLTRDTSDQREGEILSAFTTPANITASDSQAGNENAEARRANYVPPVQLSKRSLASVKVLVTTDLGSRGIDTVAVRHVLLYDVPHTTVDFIHRLGRTGRMGRRGRGYVLVGKHDRKDVVREVREAMFKGKALI